MFLIKNSAERTGITNVKVIKEIWSICLGSIDLQTFDFDEEKNFLICNFQDYEMSIFFVKYKANNFKILANVQTNKVSCHKIEE